MKKKTLLRIIFSGFLIMITLAMVEVAFRLIIFGEGSSHASIYYAITLPGNKPGYVSQPYLNYINNPGLKDLQGNAEVNSMGIRYTREIALKKPDSTFRVLFLGGSTTFGDVDDTFDVYPALIEKALRDSVYLLNSSYKNIECLNAGVHGLTSAELLTHFQFKYQYLQPDLVVIHTGFNDGFTYASINGSVYQPDYHNMRRVFRDVPDISSFERKCMISKAFAYFIIHTRLTDFLKTTLEDNIFFRFTNNKIWFVPGNNAVMDTNYNAFYNNISTLVAVAENRNAKILLVPEVCDSTKMPTNLCSVLPQGLKINRGYLEKIARQNNLFFCPLRDKEFTPDLFLDDDGIHVNERGEKLKARFIGEYIKQILRQKN